MSGNTLAWMALVGGIAIGASAVQFVRAAARPPAYMVVEYEVTDREAFQAYIKGADAIATPRVFLARHAKGTSLAGDAPKWIGSLMYPSLEEALTFEQSPEFKALAPTRDKGTKWRAYVVEGVPE